METALFLSFIVCSQGLRSCFKAVETILTREYVSPWQGKSLSLICASLTWLRNHKSSAYQTALEVAKSSFKDEPEWMIDQLLRRKREELVRSWEDREKRLENARLKEKAREERVRKKRRIEALVVSRDAGEDDGDQWMLDDWDDENDHTLAPKDALSALSKESREVLERMGLGGPKQQNDDSEALEEEIKVRRSVPVTSDMNSQSNTVPVDLLYLKNALAAVAVHHGAATTDIPCIATESAFDRRD